MHPQVRFVVAPYLPEHQPALGVSSLTAVLRAEGILCDVRYLNVEHHREVGPDLYKLVSQGLRSELLVGEMVFARALWGEEAPAWEAFVARLEAELDGACLELEAPDPRATWTAHEPRLRALHEAAPGLVARWARELLRDRPAVLGFTSTFQQNVAALAVAREVRRLVPREECAIVFGGANCEDEMGRGLAAAFPFVDHVVSGEAESVVVGLVRGILDGARTEGPTRFVPGAAVQDMDALPHPAFDDYFAAVRGSSLEEDSNLVVESARGCWWGQKSHCTFCGLNGNTMAFRSKDALRFAEELRALQARHGRDTFFVTDNILDMGYFKTLLPELIASGDELQLFYETKSNLRKDHVELLAAGRVFLIQPGIESFSTGILRLMGKGADRLQNLQLLKWCAELGVEVKWNFLYGFPGEPPQDYAEMAALLPSLVHLPVPNGVFRIRMDRFSPNWRDPAGHGLKDVAPFWTYAFAYRPLPPELVARIAYFFDFGYADGRDPETYVGELKVAAELWATRHAAGAILEVREGEAGPIVADSRLGSERIEPLDADERRLLKTLDGARGVASLPALLQQESSAAGAPGPERLDGILGRFRRLGWVAEEGGRMLSLVLDPSERRRVEARRMSLMLAREGLSLPPELGDLAWLRTEPHLG
jgi:ribosomal peptide maturation radical SAM protein 1